jgi:DNA polymerase III epsilon subunit-like protein
VTETDDIYYPPPDDDNESNSTSHSNTNDNIDVTKAIYVVFDIETTGLSKDRNYIIELAAQIIDPVGFPLSESSFSSLIKPLKPIPYFITSLTGITMDDVKSQPDFSVVGRVQEYEEENENKIDFIVFVAHNAITFDIPFLLKKLVEAKIEVIERLIPKIYVLDTLVLARNIVEEKKYTIPDDYKLSTLYNYCTGKQMSSGGHRADVDVSCLCEVTLYNPFWLYREDYIYKVNLDGTVNRKNKKTSIKSSPVLEDDSDTDESSNNISNSSTSSNETSISSDPDTDNETFFDASTIGETSDNNNNFPDPVVGWIRNSPFEGVDVKQLFEDKLKSKSSTRNNRDEVPKIGLQCSYNSVNSPLKSWRAIFTNSLLDKIVSYTNDYGRSKLESWTDINRGDLTDFISVLFVSGVQKRKDKVSNWWTDNPILENTPVKRIMTGRKFHTILRFLHCCPIVPPQNNSDDDYDPSYKIQEVMDILEKNYNRLYIPGQALSLDETLLRAFGRIKFKVRIITKAARYGIKLYVLTDAETAFVLRVIIYTGKSTYDNNAGDTKKTVQVVKKLCEKYSGSFRTIYIDRFYTSLDVMKALDGMDLFITGTVMSNRIPRELTIAKSSAEFKGMKRGDYRFHKYIYLDNNYIKREYGLVAWKDSNMVYVLTNASSTTESHACYRRVGSRIECVQRPNCIRDYNKNMGGVDLADMKRLHCNSTIMCQNRWWLKLFFYNLDVATANALILYKLSMGNQQTTTIVDYKMKLVMGLVGSRMENVMRAPALNPTHEMGYCYDTSRYRCAYCAFLSKKTKRTRFMCIADDCKLPLCSVGSGKADEDCFALSHANNEILKAVQLKHKAMMKSANKKTL